MQSLVEIDERTATGERKTSFFVFNFVTLWQSAPLGIEVRWLL